LDLLDVGKIIDAHTATKWPNMWTVYIWSIAHHGLVNHAAQDCVSSGLVGLTERNNARGQKVVAGVIACIHLVGSRASVLSSSANITGESFAEIVNCHLRRSGLQSWRSKSKDGFDVVLNVSEGGVVLVDLSFVL
jgi:hypothetical protein